MKNRPINRAKLSEHEVNVLLEAFEIMKKVKAIPEEELSFELSIFKSHWYQSVSEIIYSLSHLLHESWAPKQ